MTGLRTFLFGLIVGSLLCTIMAILIAYMNPPIPSLVSGSTMQVDAPDQPAEASDDADDTSGDDDQTASDAFVDAEPGSADKATDADDAQPVATDDTAVDADAAEVQPSTPLTDAPRVEAPAPSDPVASAETTPSAPSVDDEGADAAPKEQDVSEPVVATAQPARQPSTNENSGARAPGKDLDARQIDDEAPGVNNPPPPKPAAQASPAAVDKPQADDPPKPVTNEENTQVASASVQDETPEQPDEEVQTSEQSSADVGATDESEVSSAQTPETVPESTDEVAVSGENDEALPPAPVLSGPAFEAFAAKLDLDTSKPFLAIVLLDAGDEGVAREELLKLDIPLTFAIDPDAPDARRAEAAYREAGHEVVAVVPDRGSNMLNQRTQLAQVDTILDGYFENVPGAVAVIDRPLGDFYRNIRVVNIMTQNLSRTGRGLLVHERFGINATLGSAASKRVPAASIKRVIDTNREEAAIRASLDRGVLEASKSQSAVLFGRTYPETVSTLVTWLFGSSARTVTMAPLTATMSR